MGLTCIICLWAIKLILKIMRVETQVINNYIISILKKLEESSLETQNLNYKMVANILIGTMEAKEGQIFYVNNSINEYVGANVV